MALAFIAHKYKVLGKKGEGTFSEVLKCQNIKDGTYWACKKMKQTYESLDQVNTLREVQAMRRLSPHENILQLHEVLFDKRSGTMVLICELMDMNIYELIRGRRHYLDDSKIRMYTYDLCKSLDHMHRNGIFHRDVKPENILIKHDSVLKLADFGSCRSVYSKQPYTEYISTRWYRAPECLLTDGYYTYKMDIWSVGCVLYEIMSLRPLFPGANEVDQIAKIHDVLGSPDPTVLQKLRNKTRGVNFNFPQKKGTGLEKTLPHASPESIDLINKMCTYDPDERITAKQALRHPYFKVLRDEDKKEAAITRAKKQRLQEQQQEPTTTTTTNDTTASTLPRPSPVQPLYQNNKLDNSDTKEHDVELDTKIYELNKENNELSLSITDDKSEKDIKNKEEQQLTQEVVNKEENKFTEPKWKKQPAAYTGKSPHGVTGVKYPASILHHSTYQYRRDRDRRRLRRTRMAESGPSPVGASFFPKVPQPKPSTYQSTFHHNTYGARAHATLPKIQGVGSDSVGTSSSYLPGLTQAFPKHHKSKNMSTKTVYGTYQLPSIDRR